MLVPLIIEAVKDILDKVIPDPTKALEARNRIDEMQANGELKALENRAQTVIAELQAKGWLANNWRALIMTMFGTLIFINLVIFMVLQLMGRPAIAPPFPPELWQALMVGMGGYIGMPTVKWGMTKSFYVIKKVIKK